MCDLTQIFKDYEILLVISVLGFLGYLILGFPESAGILAAGFCFAMIHAWGTAPEPDDALLYQSSDSEQSNRAA
jgi:hypothetical protein